MALLRVEGSDASIEEDTPFTRDATVPPSVLNTEHVGVSLVDQDITPKALIQQLSRMTQLEELLLG